MNRIYHLPDAPHRRVRFCRLRFEARHSPLRGQPRLAVNPPNAILNYCCYTDTPARDSLALDLFETIRPSIGTGNCRLTSRLCSKLSVTALTWGRLVAPWAEMQSGHCSGLFWRACSRRSIRFSNDCARMPRHTPSCALLSMAASKTADCLP